MTEREWKRRKSQREERERGRRREWRGKLLMEGREKLSKFELMKEKERKEAIEGIQGRRVTNGANCGLNGELYKLHLAYTQWCTGCTCSNALEVSMTL